MIRRHTFFLAILFITGRLASQEYHGITGLLQIPSAETDSAGSFRASITWINKEMLPNMGNFGDGIPFSAPCYTFGISVFKWLQISYTGTICKMHRNDDPLQPMGYYNEDRHVNIKVYPLYEEKWWPSIALGWDDIGSLRIFKISKGLSSSGYFENIYVACSKHFEIKSNEIGVHFAYRYYSTEGNKKTKRNSRRGVIQTIILSSTTRGS